MADDIKVTDTNNSAGYQSNTVVGDPEAPPSVSKPPRIMTPYEYLNQWIGIPAVEAAVQHALSEYPDRESCGIIKDGQYIPLENKAEDSENDFSIDPKDYLKHQPFQAVVHSHNTDKHMACPSKADMVSQMSSNVPWGIILVGRVGIQGPYWWGEGVPIAPLIGRDFIHGIWDCYSLIRDYFRLHYNITLKDFPREPGWWNAGENSESMYEKYSDEAGMYLLDPDAYKPEDVCILKVPGKKILLPHHAGIYMNDGTILHHVDGRLSRREPIGPWAKYIVQWRRVKGVNDVPNKPES